MRKALPAVLVLALAACAHMSAEEASGIANKAFETYYQAFTAWYVKAHAEVTTVEARDELLKIREDWEKLEADFHLALGAIEISAKQGDTDMATITKWTARVIEFLRKHDIPVPEVPQ